MTQPSSGDIGRPLRLALIGAGNFVRKAHVPSLLALGERVEIVAVCSRSHGSAETVARMLPAPVSLYDHIPSLLAGAEIDAVDVVLPIPLLPDVTRQALEAGKHVFSEKPMAPTVAQARELLERYRQLPHRVWMVGENWRYEDAFLAAGAAIRAGKIGRPLFCDLSLQAPVWPGAPYHRTLWRRSNRFPGGFLLDGGVHHVAGLRTILGEIDSVAAMTAAHRDDLPPGDTLSVALHFANGALGSYLVTYAVGSELGSDAIHIGGTEGSLRVSRGELLISRGENLERQEFNVYASVEHELRAFVDAVQRGVPHRNTPEEALQDLAVVEAILTSAATGVVQGVPRYVPRPE